MVFCNSNRNATNTQNKFIPFTAHLIKTIILLCFSALKKKASPLFVKDMALPFCLPHGVLSFITETPAACVLCLHCDSALPHLIKSTGRAPKASLPTVPPTPVYRTWMSEFSRMPLKRSSWLKTLQAFPTKVNRVAQHYSHRRICHVGSFLGDL